MARAITSNDGKAGSAVVIAGSGFGAGTAVDFGAVPCQDPVVSSDGLSISVFAPPGVGVVAVRVTTNLGASPVVPFGQFAYDGPAPVILRHLPGQRPGRPLGHHHRRQQ